MLENSIRKIIESPIEQGVDESITYNLTTTPWGGSPSSVVSVKVFQIDDGDLTDVTDDVIVGVASINEDVIVLPAIQELEIGKTYRVEVLWTTGVSKLEAWGLIYCTR